MKPQGVLLDGDPGHDDAIAWAVVQAAPELSVLAVTTVAGNQTLAKTTANAARVMTLLGLDAPLASGADRPLIRHAITAGAVHGESGLDGPALPEPRVEPRVGEALTLMHQTLLAASDPCVIIATGPLTNVATLLLTYPEVKAKIKRIAFMGGGLRFGNWTAAAEFNMLADPEAAAIVLNSGVPLTMCPLDVTERMLVTPDGIEAIRALGGEVNAVIADWVTFFLRFHIDRGYDGAPLHDIVPVLSWLEPDLFWIERLAVEIECDGRHTTGATVADWHHVTGTAPQVDVVVDLDPARAFEALLKRLSDLRTREALSS